MGKGEEKKKLNLDEISYRSKRRYKKTDNKPKAKQSQLYFYIPLILLSFSYGIWQNFRICIIFTSISQ